MSILFGWILIVADSFTRNSCKHVSLETQTSFGNSYDSQEDRALKEQAISVETKYWFHCFDVWLVAFIWRIIRSQMASIAVAHIQSKVHTDECLSQKSLKLKRRFLIVRNETSFEPQLEYSFCSLCHSVNGAVGSFLEVRMRNTERLIRLHSKTQND